MNNDEKDLYAALDYSSEEVQLLISEFSKLLFEISKYYEEQLSNYETIIENIKRDYDAKISKLKNIQ